MSEPTDKLMHHNYDGIQEFDNDLPRWWLWLFYLTIIWGVLYFVYYHVVNIGYLSADEYRLELDPEYVRAESRHEKLFGVLPSYHSPLYDPQRDQTLAGRVQKRSLAGFREETRESDTTTYVALTEPTDLVAGRSIYDTKCASCHNTLGQGNIGPNLTDDYWLHGAGMTNTTKTIKYGFPAKGMLAWRGELTPQQILQVASYVMTLHGTNPPNPKPPQGDLVKQ
jgi:cytochrome c oxidase cbb3-type subunit 3